MTTEEEAREDVCETGGQLRRRPPKQHLRDGLHMHTGRPCRGGGDHNN